MVWSNRQLAIELSAQIFIFFISQIKIKVFKYGQAISYTHKVCVPAALFPLVFSQLLAVFFLRHGALAMDYYEVVQKLERS